jgi:hypothetical protein
VQLEKAGRGRMRIVVNRPVILETDQNRRVADRPGS